MDIGQKAAKGFFSILTRNVIARIMGLVSMVVLARVLSPSDFGLVSITEVLLNVIAVFGVTGVFEFLVSYQGEDREEMNQSAFWFNIVAGVAIVALVLIAAPFWAESQGDGRIVSLGYLVAGIFLVSCLQILPKSILSHRLDFETQTRLQNPFIILTPIGKIACAYLGFGVYSLLLPTLFFGIVQTFLFYRAVHWKFQISLLAHRWKEIYGFSKHLIGATLLTKITDDGDKIILAKFLGLEALGIYNLASQLAHLFTSNVVSITNQIFSATFPKYAHDKALMLARYLQVTKVIAFFSVPLLCCMAIAAKPMIILVYSEKWSAAILPFQILTVYAIFRTITSSYGSVINSLLVPQKAFYLSLVYAPVHLTASIMGSQYGIVALAAGVVFVKLVFVQYNIYQVATLLGSTVKKFYANLSAIAASASAASLAGFAVGLLPMESNFAQVLSIGTVFLLIYLVVLKWVSLREVREVRDFFLKANRRAGLVFGKVFLLK
ncbi:MAG: oligosaccharide flippase family protein [Saprospiraceae bacterium]